MVTLNFLFSFFYFLDHSEPFVGWGTLQHHPRLVLVGRRARNVRHLECYVQYPPREPRRHLFPLEYRSKNEGRVEETRRSVLLPLGPIPEPVHLSVFWEGEQEGKRGRGKSGSEAQGGRKAVLGDARCFVFSFDSCFICFGSSLNISICQFIYLSPWHSYIHTKL